MLKALIFDFDGTIAETERDGHRVAYNRAFEDLALPWHWSVEHYGRLLAVAGGKERVAYFVATENPPRPAGDVRELAARIHERKAERFSEIAGGISLRPGVVRLIAEAKDAGLELAIATTALESGVRAVLSHVPETLASFGLIAAGDVVARKKPAPDIYLFALDALGVAPTEAVAFEDSAVGLAAAAAAGIPTIVTPSIYTEHETFPRARAVLGSLGTASHQAVTASGMEPPDGIVTVAYLRRFALEA